VRLPRAVRSPPTDETRQRVNVIVASSSLTEIIDTQD
jgi:hypothetical protein